MMNDRMIDWYIIRLTPMLIINVIEIVDGPYGDKEFALTKASNLANHKIKDEQYIVVEYTGLNK